MSWVNYTVPPAFLLLVLFLYLADTADLRRAKRAQRAKRKTRSQEPGPLPAGGRLFVFGPGAPDGPNHPWGDAYAVGFLPPGVKNPSAVVDGSGDTVEAAVRDCARRYWGQVRRGEEAAVSLARAKALYVEDGVNDAC